VLQRLAAIAAANPALRKTQPWKAACEHDLAWLEEMLAKHRRGDDGDERMLLHAILKAFEGMPVDAYEMAVTAWLARARHPGLARRVCDCAYQPMIELMRFLEAHGFATYVAAAGDRDFTRVAAGAAFGLPGERVLGDTTALRWADDGDCGAVAYLAAPGVFDDGPAKPVRLWSRTACRPLFAVGNADGDLQLLQFAGGPARPALRLLLVHDDGEREFAYGAGAERSLELAQEREWTVVSMRRDWRTVFVPRADAGDEADAGAPPAPLLAADRDMPPPAHTGGE